MSNLESQNTSLGDKRGDCYLVLECFEDSFTVLVGETEVLCEKEEEV